MNKATTKSKVMLNLIQHLQRELLSFKNGVRGRSRIKHGMTSLFNNSKAFTLIELLVVVLIIGILAAVALPQYRWAVEKSRAAEAMVLTKAIADANRIYFMATGEYGDYPDLAIDIPGESITHTSTVHGVRTKFFACRTRTVAGDQFLALCHRRLDSSNAYSINVEINNKMTCSFEGPIGFKICKHSGLPLPE